jgi:hypothetical protein
VQITINAELEPGPGWILGFHYEHAALGQVQYIGTLASALGYFLGGGAEQLATIHGMSYSDTGVGAGSMPLAGAPGRRLSCTPSSLSENPSGFGFRGIVRPFVVHARLYVLSLGYVNQLCSHLIIYTAPRTVLLVKLIQF